MKNYLLFFFLVACQILSAQNLVKNINISGNSSPANGVEINGTFYFAADDGTNGVELWKSDGTEVGTVMVSDINTSGSSNPMNLTNADGELYFTADDGSTGRELWRVAQGGTNATLVDDIFPGTDGSFPSELISFVGNLFFVANDGSGKEIWSVSPGGSAQLLKDIHTTGSSNPTALVTDGATLYFTADDGTNGAELWWSDGTMGGTSMVTDIHASGSSNPYELTMAFGQVYFGADDGSGNRLWQSDGTTTQKIKKLACIFGEHTDPSNIIESGGEIFFISEDVLYKMIDTNPCTSNVYPFSPTDNPKNFIDVNGLLFFIGSSNGYTDNGLWISDGTGGNTLEIKNYTSSISNLTSLNGTLFYNANDLTNGSELWMSNGTVAGTQLTANINPGLASSNPIELVGMGNSLFFTADDGTDGAELWKYTLHCSQTFSPVNYDAGLHTATNSDTDTNGWTNYCDANGNLLLSLQLGSSGAVIPDSGVSIKNNTPTYKYYEQSCGSGNDCFITNPAGAAFLNTSWDVVPTSQPTSDVGVRFYLPADMLHDLNTELDNNSQAAVPTTTDLKFYKVTMPGSHLPISSITAGNVIELSHGTPSTTNWQYGTKRTDMEYYAEMMVSSFSGGGGGGSGGGGGFLPVELMHFQAKTIEKTIRLDWETATEENSKGFEIEKSRDGINWSTIHFQTSQGNSTQTNQYSYLDERPFNGINYFRLKMVDLDTYFEYSNIVSAEIENDFNKIIITPNPSKNIIHIQVPIDDSNPTNSKIRIYNSVGKMIQTNDLQNGLIDISPLQNGIYLIEIEAGFEKWTERLVKI